VVLVWASCAISAQGQWSDFYSSRGDLRRLPSPEGVGAASPGAAFPFAESPDRWRPPTAGAGPEQRPREGSSWWFLPASDSGAEKKKPAAGGGTTDKKEGTAGSSAADKKDKEKEKDKEKDELSPHGLVVGWEFDAHLLGLQRRAPNNYRLVADRVTGVTALDVANVKFPYALGIRGEATRKTGGLCDWQLVYTGLPSWSSDRLVGGNLEVIGPGFTLGVDPAVFSVNAVSRFHSGELNLLARDAALQSYFLGFRYIHFDDDLAVSELNVPLPERVLEIDARNNLYGTHFGGDYVLYDRGGPLRIEMQVACGIYRNQVRQRTGSPFFDATVGAGRRRLAYSGEIEFGLFYRVRPSVEIHGGYQLLGLGGVGLAADQLHSSDLSTERARVHLNSLIIDGGFLGVHVLW
jgi:hypothetical protein